MPNYDLDKQQELQIAFLETIKEKDAEPIDSLMAVMRFGFLSLRELTVADENGCKKERMHKIWNDMFEGICEDTDTK